MICSATCLSLLVSSTMTWGTPPSPVFAPSSVPVPVAAAAPGQGRSAQRSVRSGGGARPAARPVGNVRASSHTNLNRTANFNRNANINRNVNRNTNINRNVNVNNVNVNRGYYGGCYGCDWDDDHDFGAGLAIGAVTGAVVGAAVASSNTTTVVVSPGTVVTALPSGCSAVSANGITYQRCGSIWYQPRYMGTTVEYVVVAQP